MNTRRVVSTIVCVVLCQNAFAQIEGLDKSLSDVAEKLAVQIKDHAKKKVTVLDFTDLQGHSSELGRYMAEQMTISLVTGNRDFSIMDRANLKSILAEHKLTAEGLVDPNNAKQLGKFAGVDALILGTIIPIGTNIQTTLKVIATDTAEIVGAAKTLIPKTKDIDQMLATAVANTPKNDVTEPESPPISQQFGDLFINFENGHSSDPHHVRMNLIFINKSDKKTIAVGLYAENSLGDPVILRTSLVAGDGTQFRLISTYVTGILGMRTGPQRLTQIAPGESIKVSMSFNSDRALGSRITTFRLQSEVVVNSDYKPSQYNNYRTIEALPPYCKICNLVLDVPTGTK